MAASAVVSGTLIAATESQVIGPNPKRRAILFCAPSGSTLYFRPDPAGNVVGGIPIPSGSAPIQLTLETHGDIVKGPWFAFPVAGLNFAVIETLE